MIIRVKDNKISLHGRLWDGDELYFENEFSKIEKNYTTVYVHVHTQGGSVFAGNYIESRIRLSAPTIIMQVDGCAFSMGAFLLPAADRRLIVSNGFIMIHQAQGTTRGTASDHRSNAELLDDMNENHINGLMRITGKTRKQILPWFDGDTFFNAQKALKEGIVDEIVDPIVPVQINEKQAYKNPELFGQFEAILIQNTNTNLIQESEMKSAIIAKYGLTDVNKDSSDTAVFEALERHFQSQSKETDYVSLKQDYDTLKKQVDDEKAAKITALLGPLEGKLTKEKLATYKQIGQTSGVAALEIALEGVTARKSITDTIVPSEGTGDSIEPKAGWDWDKYQKEDQKGLEALAVHNEEAFNALYKAKFGKEFKRD